MGQFPILMVSFITVVVVQLNCVWLIATPWTAAHQASLSFTISQSLLKLMSIESVMPPPHHLIFCHPLLFLPSIFSSFRVFSSELTLHQVAKVLKLQVQHQFLKWMLRVDFLEDWLIWSPCCLRYSEESSPAPQFKSINSLDGRDRQKRQQASEGIVSCEKCHTENQMIRGRKLSWWRLFWTRWCVKGPLRRWHELRLRMRQCHYVSSLGSWEVYRTRSLCLVGSAWTTSPHCGHLSLLNQPQQVDGPPFS